VLTRALDPRAAGEARQLAARTISARQADAQAALVDALLKIEHEGRRSDVAVAAARRPERGKERQIPGAARVLSMPAATATPAG
jgi:hypothetical protein